MHKYININGKYGFGQDFKLSYSSVQQILDEMDRLGIWQTVIEFPAASNSLHRNRTLLQDLAQIPQWDSRVIPSFVRDVGAVIQKDAMDQIVQMLETYRPSCITLRPKSNKYRLRAIDIALERVKHLDPVILIDIDQIKTDAGEDDLITLAKQFPNMRFVIRQIMYDGMPFIFDAMRRADNIYLDNSWLHTRDAVKIFCQFFGEERVLFGLGPKSNGGAAMAAIAYADISEAAKDKIRCGNFINLFSHPADRQKLTENLRAVSNRVGNRFWTPFIENGTAPDVEIYDIHTHMGSTGSDWYLYDLTFENQVKAFEKDMEKYNIRKVVSSVSGMPDLIQANCEMEQAVRGKEDRFLGYVRYNPNFDQAYTDAYLEERFRGGYYVGLKTLPHYMGVDIRDAKYDRMFRYAHEHHLPVLIHCWQKSLGSPMKCAEAASKWPNAKVILGHTGGEDEGRLECEAIANDPKYSNVYFEFCGSFKADRSWEETLRHIDHRRVLYGTDACLHEISWEMGRLLSADIPDEKLTAILGANAKKLFGF